MLKVDTVYKRGILFVRLYGAINKDNKMEIDKTLNSAINKVGIKFLLLNFENVYYVNSDITKIINRWSKILSKNEGKLFVCGYEKVTENTPLKNSVIKIEENICKMQDEFSVFNVIRI